MDEKKQSNNKLIDELVELKRRTDHYNDIAWEQMDKLKKELKIGTLCVQKKEMYEASFKMNRNLYFENCYQMEEELKKNNNLMIEICKSMICEFNNYLLCSEKDRFNTNYYVERSKEIFKEHAELIEYIAKVYHIFFHSYYPFCYAGVGMYPLLLKMNPLKVDTKPENWFPFCWIDYFSEKNIIAKCFLIKIRYFDAQLSYINQFNKCQHQIGHIIDKSLNFQLKSCIFPDGFEEEGIVNIICNYLFI